MNLKYTLGALLAIPLLPILYLQGKRVRAAVPDLPEANGTVGLATSSSKQTLHVVTIGESTIAGVGVASHEEGFTGGLAQALAQQTGKHIAWRVYAKSGYTAKQVTEQLIPQIEEAQLDLMVIGLGGNDAFTANSPTKWRKHILMLIAKIRQKYPNTPIVFNNMPPIKTFPAFTPLMKFVLGNLVELLGEELHALTQDLQNVYYHHRVITLEDWIQRLKVNADPADFYSDGVHPSKLTYQVWGKDMANFIMDQEIF